MERIKKFEELIKDYIGPNKTIVETKVDNLLPPGENYVSDMVKVDVVLENHETNSKENLNLIAKLIVDRGGKPGPPPSVTKNEILFYAELLPSIKRFHEKHGLPYPEFYPEYVGGRINLTGSEEADTDGVVLLENLKVEGFANVDRHIGFDLEAAKFVLTDLATFHAVPLAMKLVEPKVFETEIRAKCFTMRMLGKENCPVDQDGTPQSQPPKNLPSMALIFRAILAFLEQDEKYAEVAVTFKKFVEEKVEKIFYHIGSIINKTPVEPFATLMHQDMWINNTMQVIRDGVVLKNKLVDFQVCNIGSPAHDLIVLLFTSVQVSCLKKHLDALLKHYHETFANILKKCNCYDARFSYEKFLEEFKVGAERGLMQSIYLISLIFGKKGEPINPEKLLKMSFHDLPETAQERLVYLCEESANREWF